jgi:NodT family efflux transporter outer membrane factor (OMF) lipoprotein
MLAMAGLLSACTMVGPDFVTPEAELPETWETAGNLSDAPIEQTQWWRAFNDPLLDVLVETAWRQNNSLEIAGLRVLEARAQLGIAQGSLYPQSQLASGSAIYTSPANNLSSANNYWQYGLGASASWEIDFWGRFARAIESADAAYLASLAARDQVVILLTAQVVSTYAVMRINEEQLRIANDNVKLQQRSFEITRVLFEQGSDSELDMQQAKTLLLSTEATIPGYEVSIRQAKNALSTLLGKPPGGLDELLKDSHGIPVIPEHIAVGIPADLLRRRPDVRQAELNAMALNAQVGFAEADLYPSFSLVGSLGLAAGGPGGTDVTDLFSADAFTFSVGPQFVWPFLNYGRIRNNVRVQDARLQQALVNYQEVVLQSAREVEDSMLALQGAQTQADILEQTVASAERSNQLSVLRYREGFSDYQRVLDSQQSLFTQQQRLVAQRGTAVLNLVGLHQSLGGGWETFSNQPLISEQSREEMQNRTNWGDLLNDAESAPPNNDTSAQPQQPDGVE